MPQHRRKPLWRWEPAPYIVLVVLLLATGSVHPAAAPAVFWPLLAVTVAFAVVFLVRLVGTSRRAAVGPDPSGDLATTAGLTVLPVGETADPHGEPAAPRVPVADCGRHQLEIGAARATANGPLRALLVPDASRWLALRLRVGVQLLVGERCYHAGFLPEHADARYHELLHELAARQTYVAVPAEVTEAGARLQVTLQLGRLSAALDAATDQPASS